MNIKEAFPTMPQAPSGDALRTQDNVTQRIDELAAQLERIDAASRSSADHANAGIVEVWRYLDTVGKHMVETDARLSRLEASEPKPPASVEGSTPQPEEFASTASAPRRKSNPGLRPPLTAAARAGLPRGQVGTKGWPLRSNQGIRL